MKKRCPYCRGSGEIDFDVCDVCDGAGEVEPKKQSLSTRAKNLCFWVYLALSGLAAMYLILQDTI